MAHGVSPLTAPAVGGPPVGLPPPAPADLVGPPTGSPLLPPGPIASTRFAVLDVETSGLRPGHPRAVAPGATGRSPPSPRRHPAGCRARRLDRLRPQRRVRLAVPVPRAAPGRSPAARRGPPVHAPPLAVARPRAPALTP